MYVWYVSNKFNHLTLSSIRIMCSIVSYSKWGAYISRIYMHKDCWPGTHTIASWHRRRAMSCSCHALWQLAKQVNTNTRTPFALFSHIYLFIFMWFHRYGWSKAQVNAFSALQLWISSFIWSGINTLIFDYFIFFSSAVRIVCSILCVLFHFVSFIFVSIISISWFP